MAFLGNPENKIESSIIEQYLTPDVIVESNGKRLSSNISEFIEYSHRMQKKYANVVYSRLLEESTFNKENTIVHFHVDCCEKTGRRMQLKAIAMISFKEEKIERWIEIFQEEEAFL